MFQASLFCSICVLQPCLYQINKTEAEVESLGIGLGSVLTGCVTLDKSFYFGFLDCKSKGFDKLTAGCLSTSPFLSLLCVTPSGDLIVSCLITETHRLPLILPRCPEVSKGDDNDPPQSLQHTKEFLANGGSSGIEPPYWRIL